MNVVVEILAMVWGAAVGAFLWPVPCLGIVPALWVASWVGFIGVEHIPIAVLTAWGVFSGFSSIVEATSPALTGSGTNMALLAEAEIVRPRPEDLSRYTLEALVSAKAVGWFIGLGLGTALYGFSQIGTSGFMTFMVVLGLVYINRDVLFVWWPLVALYFAVAKLMFHIAWGLELSHPIVVISLCVFVIPTFVMPLRGVSGGSILHSGGGEEVTAAAGSLGLMVISTFLSMFSPGISPNAVTHLSTPWTSVSKQVTALGAEATMEAMGLIFLLSGVSTTKTLLGIELSSFGLLGAGGSIILVFVATLSLVISSGVALEWSRSYGIAARSWYRELRYLGFCLSVGLTVYWLGFLWAAFFVLLGCALTLIQRGLGNFSIRSLVFLGAL
jgi:hypothetical protein